MELGDKELDARMKEVRETQLELTSIGEGIKEVKESLNDSKSRLDKLIEFFDLIGNDSMSDKQWVEAMKGLNKIEDKLNDNE